MSFDDIHDNETKINLEPEAPILVAAAWPYVNGKIHVGHLVGYFIPADIFARFNRLKGRPVIMVSGADCYGTPITVAADKEGKTPQQIVDEYHPQVIELIKLLDVEYDLFTKTTSQNHHEVVQELFVQLANNGYISKKTTKQYFSEQDQKFLPDRYVEGTCPVCKFPEARADECDNCGTKFTEGQLIDPISKMTKAAVTLKDTEHYFLNLDKLQLQLENYVEDKNYWREWVLAETKSWFARGLEGRSITRDLDWGIPIPQDNIPAELKLENAENKKFYVWFDAVIGYLSASIEWSKIHLNKTEDNVLSYKYRANKEEFDGCEVIDESLQPEWLDWKYYWKNENARHYYFMGKDNLFFHTLWWPGILLGSGQNYTLPYNVSVCQWLNLDSQRFSKSRGVVLYPDYVIKNYGLDSLRYYLTKIMPENHDTDWTWPGFVAANNNELVANVGNFFHRVLSFYKAHPELDLSQYTFFTTEAVVKEEIEETFNKVERLLEATKFSESLEEIMKLSAFGNKYFNDNEPWKAIKTDPRVAAETIYNCLTLIDNLRILLYPVLPSAMDKLTRMLGYTDKISTQVKNNQWQYSAWDHSQKLEEFIELLFTKFDEKEVLERESGEAKV